MTKRFLLCEAAFAELRGHKILNQGAGEWYPEDEAEEPTPDVIAKAQECFDRARELRRMAEDIE